MAFCANCGHDLPAAAVSCPECGHPTATSATGGGLITTDLAGFWVRFLAALIDGIITGIVSFRTPLGGIVITFLYHWLLVAFWNGQTLGKKLLNVRVVRSDRGPVDNTAAAIRSGMRLVSGFALLLGFLWAAWDPEKRT